LIAEFSLERALGVGDPHVIGVDVGGTNLRVGVVNQQGLVWEHRTQADFSRLCRGRPPAEALNDIVESLSSAIRQGVDRYPNISAVGVGFPGFIDPATQRVAQSPNLPGLIDVDLAGPLSRLLGLPILIENDALAAGYGEFIIGDSNMRSLVYMGLGTGVGGCAILDGKPYAGAHGVSMEIGHIIVEPNGRLCGCGNRGCLEQYASASGVALTYAELTDRHDVDSAQVSKMAAEGDIKAVEAYCRAAEVLAQGLASILKVLDVSHVVIGGGMSLSWHLMQATFNARLHHDLIPVLRDRISVSVSQSGDHAGIIGAALLAHTHKKST